MKIIIREETAVDIPTIYHINTQAFNTPAEADLVDALRQRGAIVASLVAEVDGQLVGHALFTPVDVVPVDGVKEKARFTAVALGPIGVLPSHQKMGIGKQLINTGIAQCREQGERLMIVLGHPSYYPKFGFRPSIEMNIHCEFDVSPEVFMALELVEGAVAGHSGEVRYQPEFRGV